MLISRRKPVNHLTRILWELKKSSLLCNFRHKHTHIYRLCSFVYYIILVFISYFILFMLFILINPLRRKTRKKRKKERKRESFLFISDSKSLSYFYLPNERAMRNLKKTRETRHSFRLCFSRTKNIIASRVYLTGIIVHRNDWRQ